MLPRLVACLCLAICAGAGCCSAPFFAGGPCADGACGSACGGSSKPCGLHSLFACQDGCGEVYVDEWLSDPPQHCDPCDNCGNFVGHDPYGDHLGSLLHKLWGYRYVPSGNSPYGDYHGYASAVGGAAYGGHEMEGPTFGPTIGGEMPEVIGEGMSRGPIAQSPSVDSTYYDIRPGETLVPGSVRVTEGGGVGEPTPASPLPSPAPHELPGPSAAKPRPKSAPASRPVMHRANGLLARKISFAA